MSPGGPLLWAAAGWLLLGLVASAWPPAQSAWAGAGALLGLVALVDAVAAWRLPPPGIRRIVAPVLAVHRPARVTLQIEVSNGSQRLRCYDRYHGVADDSGLPATLDVTAQEPVAVTYRLVPHQRGLLAFSGTDVRIASPLRLWWRHRRIGLVDEVRVMPDFSMLANRGAEIEARLREQTGIRRQRLRGRGTDFHQLREYRPGDSTSQVDWKATARHGSLVSREYEAERGQQILLLLDCSRRMRSVDHDLPHFDACLMAALRLAHVALAGGDAVGCMTFGGVDRWVRPRRGPAAATAMLNCLYDVQPTLEPPDFLQAARQVMVRQRRRALIVLVTNLRDEDSEELLPAVSLLGRRHLMLVASLREALLDDWRSRSITTLSDALDYLAVEHYVDCRRRAHQSLRERFPHLVDATADALAPAMIGQYLAIKQAAEL